MLAAQLRRGLLAGVLAGLLAGTFSLVVAGPHLEAAIALEQAAAGHEHADTFSRPVQRLGGVAGMGLTGLAVGALFGVAAAWAVGRVSGDGWRRSLKLGATVVCAVVLLPAFKYPPSPPGAVDPANVGLRSVLYLGVAAVGLALAAGAWAGARRLARTSLSAPVRQVVTGSGVLLAAATVLAALPTIGDAGAFPADLLWSFRLSSIGTQVVLHAGTALIFGLLTVRAGERRSAVAAVR